LQHSRVISLLAPLQVRLGKWNPTRSVAETNAMTTPQKFRFYKAPDERPTELFDV